MIADVAARFSIDGTDDYWSGSAIVESDTVSSTTKGLVKYSGNLQGNGELSFTEA